MRPLHPSLILVMFLTACTGSDFSGIAGKKKDTKNDDKTTDDATDVTDISEDDEHVDDETIDDETIDDEQGGGELDADGDSGSPAADDDLSGGGEFDAKLRDPLTIKSIAADLDMTLTVQYKKKDGSWSAERSVDIKEDSKDTVTIDGVCRKKDNGTGEMNLKIRLTAEDTTYTKTDEGARKTGGAGSMVKITADMDGCGELGICVEADADNTIELSCPKFLLKVDGF